MASCAIRADAPNGHGELGPSNYQYDRSVLMTRARSQEHKAYYRSLGRFHGQKCDRSPSIDEPAPRGLLRETITFDAERTQWSRAQRYSPSGMLKLMGTKGPHRTLWRDYPTANICASPRPFRFPQPVATPADHAGTPASVRWDEGDRACERTQNARR